MRQPLKQHEIENSVDTVDEIEMENLPSSGEYAQSPETGSDVEVASILASGLTVSASLRRKAENQLYFLWVDQRCSHGLKLALD